MVSTNGRTPFQYKILSPAKNILFESATSKQAADPTSLAWRCTGALNPNHSYAIANVRAISTPVSQLPATHPQHRTWRSRSGAEQYKWATNEKARQVKEMKDAQQKLATSRAQQSSGLALKEFQATPVPPAQPAHVSAPCRKSAPAGRAVSPAAGLSAQLANVQIGLAPGQKRTKEQGSGDGDQTKRPKPGDSGSSCYMPHVPICRIGISRRYTAGSSAPFLAPTSRAPQVGAKQDDKGDESDGSDASAAPGEVSPD